MTPNNSNLALSVFNSIGIHKSIPERTGKLLYISGATAQDAAHGLSMNVSINIGTGEVRTEHVEATETSTIFLGLKVIAPKSPSDIPSPGYYPSYGRLSPEQRWVYLTWLLDVSRAINISYVFLYYYGLERQLLTGDYDNAFEELLYLQKYHEHIGFISYSRRALIHSSFLHSNTSNLKRLYADSSPLTFDNQDLLVAYHANVGLSASGLCAIAGWVKGFDRKYYRTSRPIYETALSEALKERYGEESFPLHSMYRLTDIPREKGIIYANISLPEDLRCPVVPNFLSYGPFISEVRELLAIAHEKTKLLLRKPRRKAAV